MPGPLVTAVTTAQCAHMGRATPTVPNPRVTVNAQPTVLITSPYVIAGCPFATASPQRCGSAQITTAATRVMSNGQPLLLADSQAVTVPNGVPIIFIPDQTRVIAQ
jgi:hypothetical protein